MFENDQFFLTLLLTRPSSRFAIIATRIWISMALILSPREYFSGKFCFNCRKNLYKAFHKLIRDAKQHTGMQEFQSRSENKINFHVNASLTSVSLSKAGRVLTEDQTDRSFSMADINVLFSNKIITEFIFSKLDLDLNCKKINQLYLECLNLGRLAA